MAAQSTNARLLFILQQAATVGFLLYVLVLLGRSAWQNAAVNRHMTELRAEIAKLEAENNYLENLIVYMQTDEFKELEARRRLGVKKPGELVIALPPEPKIAAAEEKEEDETSTHPQLLMEAWWHYFFG